MIPCILACGCAPVQQGPAMYRGAPSRVSETMSRGPSRPDAPDLKRLSNGHYRVRQPWTVELNGRKWRVPKGYKSNGMTVPAGMKESLGDGIIYRETWAAVFHDWLFTQPDLSRAEADRLFYDLLIAYGVPGPKASLMYTTVSAYSLTKSKR